MRYFTKATIEERQNFKSSIEKFTRLANEKVKKEVFTVPQIQNIVNHYEGSKRDHRKHRNINFHNIVGKTVDNCI